VVQTQSEQIVLETLSRKIPSQNRVGGVAQGVVPRSSPSTAKKKEKEYLETEENINKMIKTIYFLKTVTANILMFHFSFSMVMNINVV
jgi:hypothetical protein